ncbi:transcription factor, putative [Medicago truncatula]|uniref:Transcription factor, putative n=1 Tax=Medicago truncatula TaxID=3880 RepID=A0A072UFQ4_MEDTR|nr:transcription factor, putative [Medicago truncatula]
MKFEDYLMEKSQEPQKRQELENEVVQLQARLKDEESLNRVLLCASLHGPVCSLQHIPSVFPPQVHELLEELALVEEEITLLERKVKELKDKLYQERNDDADWKVRHRRQPKLCNQFQGSFSQNYEVFTKGRKSKDRRASLSSAMDIHSLFSTPRRSKEYEVPRTKTGKISRQNSVENPNELSEELLKCLIGIFLELNQASLDIKESETSVSRLTLSCMQSKSFISMTNSSNYKTHSYLSNGNASCLDPYGISADLDCKARDVGPYKNFIQISSSSLETEFFSQCLPAFRKLRVLRHKLCDVDLSFLSYKQKLAFWINIYNACIMNAFLDHGLPSTQDKLLSLMNKLCIDSGCNECWRDRTECPGY